MRVTYTVQSYDILRDISGGWLGIPPEPVYLKHDYISGKRQVAFPPVKMLFIVGDEYAIQKNRMKGRFFNWGVRADFQMKF